MKLEYLEKNLKKETDCFLISSEENRLYFTSFFSTDGFLIVTGKGAAFFTDSRYFEDACQKVTACPVLLLRSLEKDVLPFLEERACTDIYIETKKTSISAFNRFRDIFSSMTVHDGNDLDLLIERTRLCKEKQEIDSIIRAQRIAENAFKEVLKGISTSVTEKALAAKLEYVMKCGGAEGVSFDTIVVSGKNSSKPHGVPGDKKIENGDFITFDFGAVYNGYHSDMTRTVGFGQVSDAQKNVYATVLEAQEKALAVLRPGVSCKDADKAARDVIEKAGFGEYFGHGTGHGVGIEIHEAPNLSPLSEAVLACGNVVTVEPGIYLPDAFGVRIEDMAVITDDGCINLTKADKRLLVI